MKSSNGQPRKEQWPSSQAAAQNLGIEPDTLRSLTRRSNQQSYAAA